MGDIYNLKTETIHNSFCLFILSSKSRESVYVVYGWELKFLPCLNSKRRIDEHERYSLGHVRLIVSVTVKVC